VPLKILLADDSMTAQKMGKEILTGAGYEVIAVSNGAAAAKKLAEKPDICILDIIMPGYTGIEVCEKVRASVDMAKTPVLLTVGKMEHFDQKDVQRVTADGVIIKPFEASDLLATVQKFVDMISAPKAAAAAASHDKTMIFTPPSVEEFKDDSYNQWKTEAEVHDEVTGEMPASKKSFELPAEMAGAPAFLDESVASPATAAESSGTSRDKTVLITPPNFPAASAAAPAPAFDMGSPPAFEAAAPPPSVETPAYIPSELTHTAAFAPASAMPEHPIEFTAQPAVDVNPPIESGFEATAHAPVEVGQAQDPALVTGTEGFDSFKTTIGSSEPAAAAPVEDDFEARVAAAMADFEEPKEEQEPAAPVDLVEEPDYNKTQKITAVDLETMAPPAESAHEPTQVMEAPVVEAPSAYAPTQVIESPVVEVAPTHEVTQIITPPAEATQIIEAPAEDARGVPEGMMDAALVEQMQAAVANLPVETAPAEEPIADAVPTPVEITPAAAPTVEVQHQDLELAKALAAAVGGDAPAAAASADHPQEVHEIAHTVTQVFNRMLPDIMEEVKRELAKRKK
jgi:CheY-like chemotaxis protein